MLLHTRGLIIYKADRDSIQTVVIVSVKGEMAEE